MKPNQSIYGDSLPLLETAKDEIVAELNLCREDIKLEKKFDPIEYLRVRIKTEESMREKLTRKGLAHTTGNALTKVYDAIGIRAICPFLDDMFLLRDKINKSPILEIVEEKDYVHHVKENGYRSLHLIVQLNGGTYAEIQLRTMSMDVWAALEHKLRYKKDIGGNKELIAAELQRCADELASTDISLQIIRDMIEKNELEDLNMGGKV